MWWGTQKTHHQNISIQSRDTKSTKNYQSKVELQERINNPQRERERERVFTILDRQNMDWKEWRISNFYSKWNREKKSQNKKKKKGWRNYKGNVIE